MYRSTKKSMNDENWRNEYKTWRPDLKPFQIKLLDEGAGSQSQACILNDMWCEWKSIAAHKSIQEIANKSLLIKDPWE